MLVDQEVKKSARRWDMKRAEQYIEHYPDDQLRTHSAQHMVDFFTEIGRKSRLSYWHNSKPSMLYGLFFVVCFNLSWADPVV